MANKGGIPMSSSMFACLTLEDDQEMQKESRHKRNIQQNSQGDGKKKDKKRNDESKQLQQMAFGAKGASGGRKKSGKNSSANNKDEQDWNKWKEHDKEAVADQFKEDLEKALLESRLQMEQKKTKQEKSDAGVEVPLTKEQKKKKKQKEKAKPMSLEEFKQLPPPKRKNSNSDDSEREPSPPPVHYRVPSTEQDTKFFNNVHNEAEHIIRHDKIQEDYRKTFAADNAVVAKLKHDIELRDKKVDDLKKQMEKMLIEMKQVKQRNKQLCVILAQGEMKDKAQVLLQVDELNAVKDELMEQVTTLTADLEKERSKNRALKTESVKLKGNKHGK